MSDTMDRNLTFGDYSVPVKTVWDNGVAFNVLQYRFAHYLSNEISAVVNNEVGKAKGATDEVLARREDMTKQLRDQYVQSWLDGSFMRTVKQPKGPSVNRYDVLYARNLAKAVRTYLDTVLKLERVQKDIWFSPKQQKNIGLEQWAKAYLANAQFGEARAATIEQQTRDMLAAEEAEAKSRAELAAQDAEAIEGDGELEI